MISVFVNLVAAYGYFAKCCLHLSGDQPSDPAFILIKYSVSSHFDRLLSYLQLFK